MTQAAQGAVAMVRSHADLHVAVAQAFGETIDGDQALPAVLPALITSIHSPTVKVNIVDSTGAGDAFAGAFLVIKNTLVFVLKTCVVMIILMCRSNM